MSFPSTAFQTIFRTAYFSFSPFIKKAKDVKNNPGPGHYVPSPSLNESGRYFNSKFLSSMCRRFGSESKVSKIFNPRPSTPGPGAYQAPSDFFSTMPKLSLGNLIGSLECGNKSFANAMKRTRSVTMVSTSPTALSQRSPTHKGGSP